MTGATSLTAFQRMLVGTDGTVTHILEAYAGEPVEVVKLHQALDVSGDRDAALELPAPEKVLRRQVLLRGRHSGRILLHAEATVAVDRVEPTFLDGLVGTDKPIGLLLAEKRTETFREILVVDREMAGPSAVHFGVSPGADVIFRTYRIVTGGRPAILITEKFPADSLRGLPE